MTIASLGSVLGVLENTLEEAGESADVRDYLLELIRTLPQLVEAEVRRSAEQTLRQAVQDETVEIGPWAASLLVEGICGRVERQVRYDVQATKGT